MTRAYTKWEAPEDSEVAFNNVAAGVWDLARFQEYVEKVVQYEYLMNNAGEGA